MNQISEKIEKFLDEGILNKPYTHTMLFHCKDDAESFGKDIQKRFDVPEITHEHDKKYDLHSVHIPSNIQSSYGGVNYGVLHSIASKYAGHIQSKQNGSKQWNHSAKD